jgi:hypothetical protein
LHVTVVSHVIVIVPPHSSHASTITGCTVPLISHAAVSLFVYASTVTAAT